MTKLSTQDIAVLIKLLRQEIEAVENIIEIGQNKDINWIDRLDHCEELIMKLLR